MFEWYVVWCGFKNRYHEDMCLKGIGVLVQEFDTYSRLNGQQCVCIFDEHKILHFDHV